MNITKEWLEEMNACTAGIDWFLAQTETAGITVVKKLLAENHFEWANWLIVRLMDRKQKIRYSCFAARQVLVIFEKQYPDDKRPRLALEAAEKCIEEDTQENRAAAREAAWEAWAAWEAAREAWAAAGEVAMQSKIIENGINILEAK